MKKILSTIVIALLLIPMIGLSEGTQYSLTTGLPTDKAYKPMVVSLDNHSDARPQVNIGMADVVYESVIQSDGYTRYLAVFNDEIPDVVEAVRSIRLLHAEQYLEWGGALVHHGQQEPPETNPVVYLQGFEVAARFNGLSDKHFSRSKRAAPHNSIADLAAMYSATPDVTPRGPLKFSAEAPSVHGEDVGEFKITYRKNCAPLYRYNADEDVYYRFYDGENPFVDRTTNAQLKYSNVIVMNAEYSYYANDGTRPLAKLVGSNTCDYFIGGKHFTGSWSRASADSNTVYVDDAGNEVLLNPGKTFIQVLSNGAGLEITG